MIPKVAFVCEWCFFFTADNRQRRIDIGARKSGRSPIGSPSEIDGRTDTRAGSTHIVHHRNDLISTPVSAITDQSRAM
jgi:hypothetical protein